jgi:hypothetical protein
MVKCYNRNFYFTPVVVFLKFLLSRAQLKEPVQPGAKGEVATLAPHLPL